MKTCSILFALTILFSTIIVSAADLFPNEDTIPILSWYCIEPSQISVEHYQELKDCGFNLSFPHIYSFEYAQKALDCAAAVGIRTLFMCNELYQSPEKIVPLVKNHPGLAGYHLRDEPHSADIPNLKVLNDKIRALDSAHFTYLNLLPIVVSAAQYIDYINYCYKEVETEFLSYDHYGIADNAVRANYYQNLEIFSAEARKMNKPFWAFALATAHGPYPIPSVAHLKFQMYSNLAYGAQGLQYFTYWNPGTQTWDFHDAPILQSGKRSAVYDMVREVNMELQKRNFVFMRSKVLWVRHTGTTLPVGTIRLTELPFMVNELDTHGDDAVVSLLQKGEKFYLVIVNANIDKTMNLTINLKDGVKRIRKDGTIVDASEYSPNMLFGPGECEVFAAQK